MTSALLITYDPHISGQVQELATRAGVRLSVRADIALTSRVLPAVTLVGAARVTTVDRVPASAQMIIAVDGSCPMTAAGATNGPPMFSLPRDEYQLMQLLEATAAPVLDRLRAAGHRIGFTDRGRRQAGYVTPLAVTDWRRHPGQAVYVNCGRFACGDAAAGLAHVVQRSNFRSLHRRFPETWTDTVARDVTELGAFIADLPQAAVNALCSLAGTDAVLDEDDHRA
ncbi:hypothetical protein [Actinoplanes sp. GCM10030250]|uniref:hypothetical protein n=1 Tax=Actinoplanes sp. GCM10030250 TaxID=3273376 RepID=UPI0036223DCE